MDETSIREHIIASFPDIGVTDANGDSYFFVDPEKKHPFATLVTSNAHDQVSDLNRPGIYRLNIGVSKQTFSDLFEPNEKDVVSIGYDYRALDRLMPHPVYGKMHWVCVLNPGAEMFERVKRLLVEAYEVGRLKYPKPDRTPHQEGPSNEEVSRDE